ncbi:hypothetical protein BT69DRAFT_859695 [Atractiella rhizophila]|nr:hypothetical protein BT69DRAFT_859695 [Atractiella rhizophila]
MPCRRKSRRTLSGAMLSAPLSHPYGSHPPQRSAPSNKTCLPSSSAFFLTKPTSTDPSRCPSTSLCHLRNRLVGKTAPSTLSGQKGRRTERGRGEMLQHSFHGARRSASCGSICSTSSVACPPAKVKAKVTV